MSKLSVDWGAYHICGGTLADQLGLLDQAPKMGRTLWIVQIFTVADDDGALLPIGIVGYEDKEKSERGSQALDFL